MPVKPPSGLQAPDVDIQKPASLSSNDATAIDMGKRGLSDTEFIRFSRQILLPQVGERGQLGLLNAKVLIIGMGGLGNQLAQLLAAAGIGHISFVDHDKVELSNLPRQLLFDGKDIGQRKVDVAKNKLLRAYPDVRFTSHDFYFDRESQPVVLRIRPDIVFDCTDNFTSRQVVNALCVEQGLPLVSAAIAHFNGQLMAYLPDVQHCACYQCLYPANTHIGQSCSQSGVLGASVATVASMQALLGINLLTSMANENQDTSYGGILHRFDGKTLSWSQYRLVKDPQCPVCGPQLTSDTRQRVEV